MLTLYSRSSLTLAEAERQLDEADKGAAVLRQMVEALYSQAEHAQALEAHLSAAATMLTLLPGRVDEIERTDDWDAKRHIVELLVSGIAVRTVEDESSRKADVTQLLAFGQPSETDSRTRRPTEDNNRVSLETVVRVS